MTHYFALVHKEMGSAYGISFPDLPGCFSAADAQADIIPNAMEAIELFLDGAPEAPHSRDLEALTADPDVTSELAAGAYLLAVPHIDNTQKTTRVNITLNKGLLDAIDAEATRRKMTRSGLIAQAAERELAVEARPARPGRP
ncbi:MAG: type II toxin-antitoxin system HicB family antitoxin [Roseitalea porphyridii]|uniref:type II toxin-antitoxin system HicB family antitoxin n=1 Tax=Roseitalea porphyridii TaxID=1852022 RepID=UPI0032F09876